MIQKLGINFFHYWINELFSEDKKVPEHCLKTERWQGPPHVNRVKQFEIVLFFKGAFFK